MDYIFLFPSFFFFPPPLLAQVVARKLLNEQLVAVQWAESYQLFQFHQITKE